VAGVVASILTYRSQDDLKSAYGRFVLKQDFARALRDVRDSDSPLFPSVYRDVGVSVSLLQIGHPVQAERVAAESAERSPGDVRTWVTLARIQATRGRLAAARRSWDRARQLNPILRPGIPDPFRF
jgi:hypothetical protein